MQKIFAIVGLIYRILLTAIAAIFVLSSSLSRKQIDWRIWVRVGPCQWGENVQKIRVSQTFTLITGLAALISFSENVLYEVPVAMG